MARSFWSLRPFVGQRPGLVVAAPPRLRREDRLGLLAVRDALKFHLYEQEERALGHASDAGQPLAMYPAPKPMAQAWRQLMASVRLEMAFILLVGV